MYFYHLYNRIVASDIPFLQLMPAAQAEPDITIHAGEIPPDILSQTTQKYDFGRERSWLINTTCYLIIEHGASITYHLREGGNPMYLQTYILGWGMSMLALQRNELAIHCSAVANEDGAVLICGESGCGKSTLTTAFLQQGYHLMADDMALVEATTDGAVYAKPAFPFQKLCREDAMRSGCPQEQMIYIDETKDKFLVPYRGEFSTEPARIRCMLVLFRHYGEVLLCNEINGIDKMRACAENLFLRHLLKEKKYDPAIGSLCLKMAAGIPIHAIGRPDGKDTLDEMIRTAFSLVQQ